jgi:predicted transcriptional regulator YheO
MGQCVVCGSEGQLVGMLCVTCDGDRKLSLALASVIECIPQAQQADLEKRYSQANWIAYKQMSKKKSGKC